MRNSLQLTMQQSQNMTLQLQRSIQLLQLSSIELLEVAEDAADENPFVELRNLEPYKDNINYRAKGSAVEIENFSSTLQEYESLQQYLWWQIELSHICAWDKIIAEYIIYTLNDKGLLLDSIDEILQGLNHSSNEFKRAEVVKVLKLIQTLDPIGIAASSATESLLIQLCQLPSDTPGLTIAKNILQNHLSLLASQDFIKIADIMHCNITLVEQASKLIKSLNPMPANSFSAENTKYIVPDVFAYQTDQGWQVSLNHQTKPAVKVNHAYINMLKNRNKGMTSYAKSKLQDAKWLASSIDHRNHTLLAVAQFLVDYQKDFMLNGTIALQPLNLATVASYLNLHESTISRITTEKYIHTLQGIFELKQFFSGQIKSADGKQLATKAVKQLIKNIVEKEDTPMSDMQISSTLEKQGINIARRTITKYREKIGIETSSVRKLLSKMP